MTPEEEVFAAGMLVLCLCIIGMTVAIRKGASNPASEQAVVDFVSTQALPELLVDAVLKCPPLPERALLDAVVTFDAALKDVHRYASRKYGTESPTVKQVNSAISDAMKQIGRAAKKDGDAQELSSAEQKDLAKTWKSVVAFAKDYAGLSVADLTQPSE